MYYHLYSLFYLPDSYFNRNTVETCKASVELIQTKEYFNVNEISDHDHLTDDNWHIWKEQMQRVIINCGMSQALKNVLMKL